jgi:Tfp pilus assembly protein PilV
MNTTKLNLRRSSDGFTPQRDTAGFTLAEALVAMGIGVFVVAGMLQLYMGFLRAYRDTTSLRNTSSRASMALERMVHGTGNNDGLYEASASTVTASQPSGGWLCTYNAGPNLSFQWTKATGLITDQSGNTICSGVITSSFATTTSAGGAVNGCNISVTVSESSGGRSFTNVMNTFVQFRNQ